MGKTLVIGVAALLLLTLGLKAATEATLLDAVKRGDVGAVRALLRARSDANMADPDGTSALHWAVRRDDVAAAEALLGAGANARAENRYGVTPLALATTNGSAAMIERLLAAGADVNAAQPGGETALMTAARAGNAGAVRALLARGANVRARESVRGQTALMWAAAENNAAVVKLLIEAGADVRERSRAGAFSPLLFAVRGGHVATAVALLDAGAPLDDALPDGTSALVLAVINAHYELAGALLERGADPNAAAQGWTALHQIAWSRRHNAGFNLPGPVQTGALDSLDLVRKLVARGANVNARVTKEPKDGNRNMLNRIGATPFLMAAKSDDVALMRVLLEVGADASLKTNLGTTALMVAAGVGIWAPGENPGTHEEALAAVTLALEAGGGAVNDVDQEGETALHGAVYRGGAIPVIQFLLDRGAALDVVNKRGWTPLTAAEGVEYTPAVLKRYPEAADLLRGAARERPAPAAAARAQAAAPAKSIWDGAYTEGQAARGQERYRTACGACHAEDLLGAQGPALAGQAFLDRWAGSTVFDMVQVIKQSMPQEAPDSLGMPAYVDIVAYLLKGNGGPAGSSELPTEADALRQILVANRAAGR
ncbi:MAG TPA: ankyrin repeat domain-containing protein [Vicinamibacterales bacterium]|nr:ankyrin repeat domain-containing protein [Vicinamibacterales bacterium]